jgi:LIM domain
MNLILSFPPSFRRNFFFIFSNLFFYYRLVLFFKDFRSWIESNIRITLELYFCKDKQADLSFIIFEKYIMEKDKKCNICGHSIGNEDFLTSPDKTKNWHEKCFKCAHCDGSVEDGYHEKEEKLYCEKCYGEKFGERCHKCNNVLTGEFKKALGHAWHVDCFCCVDCGTKISGPFIEKSGSPQCKGCNDKSCPICAGCEKNITGTTITTAIGRKWHPDCFKCAKCDKKKMQAGLFLFWERNEVISVLGRIF